MIGKYLSTYILTWYINRNINEVSFAIHVNMHYAQCSSSRGMPNRVSSASLVDEEVHIGKVSK